MGDVVSLRSSNQAQKIAEKTFWSFINKAYAGEFYLQSTDPKTGTEIYLVASETPVDTAITNENSLEFCTEFFDNVPRLGLVLSDDCGALVMQIANMRYFQFLPLELALLIEPYARSHFTKVVSLEKVAANP